MLAYVSCAVRASLLLAGLASCASELAHDPGATAPDAGGAKNDDPGGGGGSDQCSDSAKLVYVVDQNNQLSQFDPAAKTFKAVGTLDCPAELGATPFSMGIDRTPTAWVLYNSGELFEVNTSTVACKKTNWTPS